MLCGKREQNFYKSTFTFIFWFYFFPRISIYSSTKEDKVLCTLRPGFPFLPLRFSLSFLHSALQVLLEMWGHSAPLFTASGSIFTCESPFCYYYYCCCPFTGSWIAQKLCLFLKCYLQTWFPFSSFHHTLLPSFLESRKLGSNTCT